MIGFLEEFWNNIVSATEGTVEWFQSIGNAVAGALGNLLFYPLQMLCDFFIAVTYLFTRLIDIIVYLLAPLIFLFDFLKGIIDAWTTPQTLTAPTLFDDSIIQVIINIPMMSTFLLVLVSCFWFVIFNKTLHTLKH